MERFYTFFFVAGIGCFAIAFLLSMVFPWMSLKDYHGMEYATLEQLAATPSVEFVQLQESYPEACKGEIATAVHAVAAAMESMKASMDRYWLETLSQRTKRTQDASSPKTLTGNAEILKLAALQKQLFEDPRKDDLPASVAPLAAAVEAVRVLVATADLAIDKGLVSEADDALCHAKVCMCLEFALQRIVSLPKTATPADLMNAALDIQKALKRKGHGKTFELPAFMTNLLSGMVAAGERAAAAAKLAASQAASGTEQPSAKNRRKDKTAP
jgi:hypothetical protein